MNPLYELSDRPGVAVSVLLRHYGADRPACGSACCRETAAANRARSETAGRTTAGTRDRPARLRLAHAPYERGLIRSCRRRGSDAGVSGYCKRCVPDGESARAAAAARAAQGGTNGAWKTQVTPQGLSLPRPPWHCEGDGRDQVVSAALSQRATIPTSRADGSPKMVPKSLGDDHERFRRAVATTRA